jgi:hypothetical protein
MEGASDVESQKHSPRNSQVCGEINILNKNSYFLGSTYFKLWQIEIKGAYAGPS